MEKPYSCCQRATQTSFSIVLPSPNTQTKQIFLNPKRPLGHFWIKERGIGLKTSRNLEANSGARHQTLSQSCRFVFVCFCSQSSFLAPMPPRFALHRLLCSRLILCLQELRVRGGFNEGQCKSLCKSLCNSTSLL